MIEWFEKAIDFSNILNISITASWLILVVIGLRFVLKRAPKWVNVALWGIVALRLLMPFSIESSLSLIPSVETVSDQLLQAEPAYSHQAAQLDIVTNPNYGSFISMELDDSMDSVQWSMVKMSLVWYAGIAVMSIYTAVSYLILRRKLRTAVILKDNLFQCETVNSPFVLGIIKPRIYLPYTMDDQNLKHVVAHEQAHIRRKDHWWKPLGFLLLTIHWFNPLMWVAYILLCRDIELACDEKVIAELGNEQRADYTQALVACAVNRRMIAACPLAFGEVGVKDRVKSIMNYRKPAFWIILTALVVCVVVAVCFLTNPKDILTLEPIIDSLSVSEVDWAQITIWGTETEHILLDESQIQDLIKILNDLEEKDFVHSKVPEHDLSLMIYCGEKEILLHWDGEYTEFIFDSKTALHIDEDYRYVCNQKLNLFLSRFYPLSYHVKNSVKKWFDYIENPSQMSYEDELKIQLEEFPDITFKYTPYDIIATTSWEDSDLVGRTILISGLPIWNAYFCDLTGDGLPEICAQVSYGSGMIDNRVIIIDYANGINYKLEDRGYHDYYLRMNDADGYLYVDKRIYNSDELISSGKLVFKDGCIQIEGVSSEPQELPADNSAKMESLQEIAENYVSTVLGLDAQACTIGPQLAAYGLGVNGPEVIDYEMYSVFCGDKVVAFVTYFITDTGESTAGCGAEFAEALWAEYSKAPDREIAIVYAREGAYLVREGDAPVLLHRMPLSYWVPIEKLEDHQYSIAYGSVLSEQIQLETQKFTDENLIKKISKDLDLPADCSLSFIGEYSDGSDALLWFAIEGNYPDRYVAVECEKKASDKYKFIDSYSPMTYALDIVHVVWKAEDIFLVNNRDCAQIVYMNEARKVIQEIDVAEYGLPYVFRLSMPTNPGICSFIDANGEEIR